MRIQHQPGSLHSTVPATRYSIVCSAFDAQAVQLLFAVQYLMIRVTENVPKWRIWKRVVMHAINVVCDFPELNLGVRVDCDENVMAKSAFS